MHFLSQLACIQWRDNFFGGDILIFVIECAEWNGALVCAWQEREEEERKEEERLRRKLMASWN